MAEAKTLPWQMDTGAPGRADPDSTLKDYWKNLEYELIPVPEGFKFGFQTHLIKPPPSYEGALLVQPVPSKACVADLEDFFSPYGELLDTRILTDEGYAAVVFAVKDSGRKAQQALNGQLLFLGADLSRVHIAGVHIKPGPRTTSVDRPTWCDDLPHNPILRYLTGRAVQSDGTIQDENGALVGQICEGSIAGHSGCTVQSTDSLSVTFDVRAHRGDVVSGRGRRVATASLMPWKEKQLRQQGYGVSRSFRPEYDILIGKRLNEDGEVLDSDGKIVAFRESPLASNTEGMPVATDGEVLDKHGILRGTVLLPESPSTEASDEEDNIEDISSKTIEKYDEGKDKKTSEDMTKEEDKKKEDQEQEAPKPAFYTHYTISRDLSGSNDEVATKLLSALAERERSRENRFAKADLTLLASRR